jgi:hypothetical protein
MAYLHNSKYFVRVHPCSLHDADFDKDTADKHSLLDEEFAAFAVKLADGFVC